MADTQVLRRLAAQPAGVRARILASLTPPERAKLDQLLATRPGTGWTSWARDPVGFVQDGLGETVWSKQREILESVRDNKRTAVPACHAPGKSFIAARAVAWFGAVHAPGTAQIVTTATSFRQVRTILWPHIRRVVSRHNLPGAKNGLSTVEWKAAGDIVAFGFSAADNDETAVQGIHAPNLLIVVDEAGGIAQILGQAFEALMTGSNTRLLLLGNPATDAEDTWFERCCNSPRYNVIRIPASATPNFTGEDAGRCQACPQSVPSHPVAEHLVDRAWVDDVTGEFGEGSPFVEARVHARFPENVTTRVIPLGWAEAATENDRPDEGEQIRYGVDIAADGGDEFVIARADGWAVRVVHRSSGKQNANAVDVAATIMRVCQAGAVEAAERGLPAPRVKVDAIGLGWGVVSTLERWGEERKHGFDVVPVHVGQRSREPDRFANQRAELWWLGRELVQHLPGPDGTLRQRVRLDVDRPTLAQLAGPMYKSDSAGRIVIEKKADMKKRGVLSPDRAEAVLLAFFEPPGLLVLPDDLPVSLTQTNEWNL